MHIPDGFIPLWQCAFYFALVIPFVSKSISWAKAKMNDASTPLFATLAAGIFAIQAINIPIPFGTSGHLIGGVLIAILMGSPFASVLILTLVLIIQSLLFADGGITTLGANILNMGVIGPFIGFYSFKIMEKKIGIRAAAFLGAWLGTFVPAIAVAVELALANTFPLMQGMLFIGAYHALIGLLIEGIITSVVVCSVKFPIFRVMG